MTNVAPNKLIYALRCGFAEGHNAPKCIQERCPYYHKIEFDKKRKTADGLLKCSTRTIGTSAATNKWRLMQPTH